VTASGISADTPGRGVLAVGLETAADATQQCSTVGITASPKKICSGVEIQSAVKQVTLEVECIFVSRMSQVIMRSGVKRESRDRPGLPRRCRTKWRNISA
jgi:hypothetical protein